MKTLALAGGVALLLALFAPAMAGAQTSPIPVHVERMTGPAGNQITNAIRQALRRQRSVESVSAAAAETRMGVVFVRGDVARSGRRSLRVELRVYSADGTLVGDIDASASSPARLIRTLRQGVWRELEPLLQDAVAAVEGSDGPAINLVVRDFLGPGAESAHAAVEARLRLRRNLTLLALNVPMTRPSDYVAAAHRHQVAAFIEGDLERGRREVRLVITVRSGETGELVAELRLAGANPAGLRRAIRNEFWASLGSQIEAMRPPQPEAAAAPDEIDEAEEEESSYAGPRPSPLTVSLGGSAFSRSYTYNDDVFNQLSGYRLKLGPALLAELQWYPLAHFRGGAIADLGIEAHTTIGLAIRTAEGDQHRDTSVSEWAAGLIYRLSLGPARLRFGAGIGSHGFAIEGTDQLPEVSYFFARFHLAGAIEVARGLDVEVTFAWRHLLSVGEFANAEWFPRSTGAGLDGRLGLGYRLTQMWAIHLSFDLRRYFFSLNPEPGDRWIAGGALDQYLGASLRVSFAWPASEGLTEDEIDTESDEGDFSL